MGFLSGLFKKKPGGTFIGNFLRSGAKIALPGSSAKIDKVTGLIPAIDMETQAKLDEVKAQNNETLSILSSLTEDDSIPTENLDAQISASQSSNSGNALTNTLDWFKSRIEEFTGGLKSTGDNLGKASDVASSSTNKLLVFGGIAVVLILLLRKRR